VWTNVGEAHLGFFASIDEIAEAKAEILEGASAGSLLVANADDDRVASRARKFAGKVTTFGIERDADVHADDVVDRGIDGTTARVTTPRGAFDLSTPLVGRGNLANVLAATAVALHFDVPLPSMAERAASLKPAHHRGDIVRLARGVVVVDDSYNANPTATRRAIDVLRSTRTKGRRVAVIGEMLELGERSNALHESVGRAAVAAGVDELVAVGGEPAKAMADAAIAAGMSRTHVRYFATSDQAADAFEAYVHDGDLVLVKGSRGIRTDVVVDRLTAEFA
jgi:UDP-N-acetylmuramoyl-tripeptide--D-alanyl-D-alanine ligase